MNNYVCYHLHTELSLLDSCTNHKEYTDRAVELGQKAICFTEHGNIFCWIEKKMYANSKGLKYLHGCEVYLTASSDPENKIRDNYHTILIAKNYDGVKELNTLIDLSTQKDHFYYKPRLFFEEFLNISDNIIKISACLASPLSKYPSAENADKNIYEQLMRKYDYYEIQPHLFDEQIKYNNLLLMASKKYNKPLIAATDTHSLDAYKAECRTILQKAKGIEYADEDTFDLTYKSYDELVGMFRTQASIPMDEVLKAIENTNIMADSVEDFELDTSFKYPKLYDNEEEELKKRINKMYKDKLNRGIIQKDPRYKEMVNEEMRVFKKIGMVGFMLFMSELVCWCWDNNIPVGYCRGSVGGSMIAYLTDIIDVNPITWNTMFSRFANEDRTEIGDIDIDLPPSKRHLVYKHIIEAFGANKTGYVLAMDTIADKGTIDEIGRAFAIEYKNDKDVFCKKIIKTVKAYEGKYECELDDATWKRINSLNKSEDNPYSLQTMKQIKSQFDEEGLDFIRKKYPEIFYYFDGLSNTVISQSMHPAGIVVSPVTLPDNYGTFWNDDKRIMCITMEEIHEVSLVKYDLLGLRNVEIISDCCDMAHLPYPKSYNMDWNDNDVWEHLTDSPVGIFQMESQFAFDCLKKMHCKCIDDLTLVNASVRPSGESYRERLLNREINTNPSELIDELLAPNHGFLVYQEDVIAFLQKICGLSGSEADNIRRAIGRKQVDRLQAALPRILEGYCSKSNKPREVAEEEAKTFLQIIEDSSNYMFGRNHSTGYSMITYTCGYMRYHYPVEFVTAYLNNAQNDVDTNKGIELAKQLGVEIKKILFRHSQAMNISDAENKCIYKGISSIKYMNDTIANELYELRNNQYSSFIDLLCDLKNTSINSRQLDILIRLDFFEEFGEINTLLKQIDIFNALYNKKQMKKDKLGEFPEWIFAKFGTETKTQYKIEDWKLVVQKICDYTTYPKTSRYDILMYELDCLGSIQTTIKCSKDYYIILEVKDNWITLYQLATGDQLKIKCRKKTLNANPIKTRDVIKVIELVEEKKWRKDDAGNWYQIDDTEQILKEYKLIVDKIKAQ